MRASDCQALCAVEQWKMICSQSAESAVVMTVKHAILVAILTIKTIYYILCDGEIAYNGIANANLIYPGQVVTIPDRSLL